MGIGISVRMLGVCIREQQNGNGSMDKIEQLHEFLTEHGFKFRPVTSHEMNGVSWYAWRASKLPARECECNNGKPAQLVVYPYSFNIPDGVSTSVEVEICG